jgi:hypothetical protein
VAGIGKVRTECERDWSEAGQLCQGAGKLLCRATVMKHQGGCRLAGGARLSRHRWHAYGRRPQRLQRRPVRYLPACQARVQAVMRTTARLAPAGWEAAPRCASESVALAASQTGDIPAAPAEQTEDRKARPGAGAAGRPGRVWRSWASQPPAPRLLGHARVTQLFEPADRAKKGGQERRPGHRCPACKRACATPCNSFHCPM